MKTQTLLKKKKGWSYGNTILRAKVRMDPETTATVFGVFVGTRGTGLFLKRGDSQESTLHIPTGALVSVSAVTLGTILQKLNREEKLLADSRKPARNEIRN